MSAGQQYLTLISQSMTPKMSLHFHDFGVIMQKGDTEYAVDPKQVWDKLGEDREPESFSTGLMETGTIYVRQRGDTRALIHYRKPQLTGLWFEDYNAADRTVIRVVLPGLLLVQTDISTRVYAVKQYPTIKTPLFRAPLANIGNGSVCFGSVPIDRAGLPSEIWATVLGSVMNNHSLDGSISHSDIRDKLSSLQGADQYDLDDLKPSDMTVGQLITSIERWQ